MVGGPDISVLTVGVLPKLARGVGDDVPTSALNVVEGVLPLVGNGVGGVVPTSTCRVVANVPPEVGGDETGAAEIGGDETGAADGVPVADSSSAGAQTLGA